MINCPNGNAWLLVMIMEPYKFIIHIMKSYKFMNRMLEYPVLLLVIKRERYYQSKSLCRPINCGSDDDDQCK